MSISGRTLSVFRNYSTALSKAEKHVPQALTSEFYEHIRHQVYGDSKKVDKVVVKILKEEKEIPVLVNRNVSTPYQCLSHISKHFADDGILVDVVPSVGSSFISSMNQPIQDQSTIRKIAFDSDELTAMLNEVYWRSCSLLTAAMLKDALSDSFDFKINNKQVQDGYFSLNVSGLKGIPFSSEELQTINRFAKTYISDEKSFECLHVPSSIAKENNLKGSQLVRIKNHVFDANGPVIRSTSQIGRYSIVNSKQSGSDSVAVCGVSLPVYQPTSSYSWTLIAKNAAQKFIKNT